MNNMITEVNELNFEAVVKESKLPVLVKFYRKEGCQPCKDMEPIFADFANKHSEVKCLAYEVNPQMDSIMRKYFVTKWPTFYSFNNGEIINKRIGKQTEEQLLSMMDRNVPKEIRIKELKSSAYDLIKQAEILHGQLAQVQDRLVKINAEIESIEK